MDSSCFPSPIQHVSVFWEWNPPFTLLVRVRIFFRCENKHQVVSDVYSNIGQTRWEAVQQNPGHQT